MHYIADLHIHSCFSRATSKASRLPGLAAWAAIKGIQVLGTGDFTHPGWLQHLQDNLEPAEPGFFKLTDWNIDEIKNVIPESIQVADLDIGDIRFVLSSEISSIYKKDGKVRKIHNILYAPDFTSVQNINKTLAGIGNIESDGRPILGLDARNLLEIFLDHVPGGFFVPAHIWTPWFSLFGSKSGFNRLEECFEELSPEIFALETGLSSDPDMNRCISALDRFTLISNSDCHSPAKLGREANIFSTDFDFAALQSALRAPLDAQGNQVFAGTIEFYPEEGKYHCDGHRKCHISLTPEESIKLKDICPVCGKPVTVGVLHRVMDLADRVTPMYPKHAPAVHSLIPLPELLSEIIHVGPNSKKVMQAYGRLIQEFSSEFNLLLDVPIMDIADSGSPLLAEAIDRVRRGHVIRQPGYDGAFGVIRVFTEDELSRLAGQLNLFATRPVRKKKKTKQRSVAPKRIPEEKHVKKQGIEKLNTAQQEAVQSSARYILVQAGPGTGKTHTLISRLLHQEKQHPGPATVITFTNKAAEEVRERLYAEMKNKNNIQVATLHGYCLHVLRQYDGTLRVAGPKLRTLLLRHIFPADTASQRVKRAEAISRFAADPLFGLKKHPAEMEQYFQTLSQQHLVDLDAIISSALQLLNKKNPFCRLIREQTGSLYIDEFQDLNAAQYQLVKSLAQTSPVFAIGDPDQAIYGFRGADPHWFYQFVEDLSPQVYRLKYNYRCDKNIVKAADHVIARHHRSPEETKAVSMENGQIRLQKLSSPYAEARFVAAQIEELLAGTSHRQIDKLTLDDDRNFSLRDIGILYRTSRQAEILAHVLFQHGIPYQVVDLIPFFRKGAVNILYHLTLVAANKAELNTLLFLFALEPGIGKVTLSRLEDELIGKRRDVLAVLETLGNHSKKVATAADNLLHLINDIQKKSMEHGVANSLELALSKYTLCKNQEDILRFFRLAGSVGSSLEDFAEYLLENSTSVFIDEQAEAVTLMTMHAAKGVEFPAVFLVGLEEDLLPLRPREELSDDARLVHVMEERRLFFVGLTRAKHQLYLSWVTQRGKNKKENAPSRFIQEIPSDLMQRQRHRPRRIFCKQLSLFSLR